MKQLEIKYQLQSGVLTPDAWKKKIEETFAKDKYHIALWVIESLSTEGTDNFIPIEQKLEKAPWKKDALTLGVQLINPDIEIVKEV